MTHDEMIKVIEHHKNGGEIEYKNFRSDVWADKLSTHLFNFEIFDYRIKEKPKTKLVWFWKIKGELGNWFIDTDHAYSEEEIMKVYPVALEYKRMDILGSEEVPND